MKRISILIFIITLSLAFVPFFAAGGYKNLSFQENGISNQITQLSQKQDDNFLVLDTTTGETLEISGFDYVCGAVAAEMPLLYHDEAIKAQAVAAYTYACREREIKRAQADKKGSDLTADSSKNQGYIGIDRMKQRWGKNFDKYYDKLTGLVAEVYGQKILYKGEPILAVYHAISGGQTEDCATVWGSKLPYLVPVDSKYDTEEKEYSSRAQFTPDELKENILKMWPETIFSDNPSSWLGKPACSKSGTVESMEIGSAKLTGMSVRRCLGLRSAVFTAEYKDDMFTFWVSGYGHGVGMSQTGANRMAKQGADYIEILTHYYSGVTVE